MFPYFELPELKLGPVTLHPFGALVVAAVLVGKRLIEHRAERLGLSRRLASRMCVWMLVCGFLGAHWAKVLSSGLQAALANPLIFLKAWEGIYSLGGLAGGIIGALLFASRYRVSSRELWHYLDVTAYAFPFAWAFGRLGCAIVHDHPGVATANWLAVRYPGGPRYDLGLLEVLYTVLLAGTFFLLDRQQRPRGFYLGLFLALYGAFRFFLDRLQVHRALFLGLTLDQHFAVIAILTGLAALARLPPAGRDGAVRNVSQQPANSGVVQGLDWCWREEDRL